MKMMLEELGDTLKQRRRLDAKVSQQHVLHASVSSAISLH